MVQTVSARRRARKRPADVRREEILAAAVRVFARTSYRAAGTAEIAREAGVAEPTIYRHFDSKRELYLAALRQCGTMVRDTFRDIAARTSNGFQALQEMGSWYGQSIQVDPDHLRLRQRAFAETEDDEVRACLLGSYLEIIDIIMAVIQRGQQQGAITTSLSSSGAAWLFVAVGQVLDIARLMGLTTEECTGAFKELSDTFAQVLSTGLA